jgi:hypothetical protein
VFGILIECLGARAIPGHQRGATGPKYSSQGLQPGCIRAIEYLPLRQGEP